MSVVARLEVIPTREGSMTDAVASAVEALDDFDVSYETTPTDTVVEADDPGEVFAAAEAAHRAVADDRVITSLEVDDERTRTRHHRQDRVAAVERRLGRPAKRERRRSPQQEARHRGGAGGERSTDDVNRYGGPWQSGSRRTDAGDVGGRRSRYLRTERPVSR